MIGNAHDAAFAATCPADFEIGEGNSRIAYLINGVVYKVQKSDRFSDNRNEWYNVRAISDSLPNNVFVPDCTLYGDVLAMELVEGILAGDCIDNYLGMECSTPDACISERLSNMLSNIGFVDQSYGNMIIRPEGVYLIDLA